MKISIITPTFNSELNILRTLRSIKNQKIKNKECLFIDSHSKDNTINLINKNIQSKKIICEKDNGIYDALNKGIKTSKGSIISILHSNDNYYSKDVLKFILDKFKKNNVNVIFGDLIYKKANGKVLRKWISFNKHEENKILKKKNFTMLIEKGWMPPHTAVFIKKSFIKEIGRYNTKYSISSDYDYLIRVFKNKKLKALYVNKILVSMAWGGKSNKVRNIFRKMTQDLSIIKKHKIGGLDTLIMKNISKIRQFL